MGTILFMGYPKPAVQKIWDPIPKLELRFPLSLSMILYLCQGSNKIRKSMMKWLTYDIPEWSWSGTKANEELTLRLKYLKNLKLLTKDMSPTKEGRIAVSLVEEGEICIFVGYVFSKYGKLFSEIKSVKDYLYVVSHFMPIKITKGAPNLDHASVSVSDETRDLVKVILSEAKNVPKLTTPTGEFVLENVICPTEEITALYVLYPNVTAFKAVGYSDSELDSLMLQFYKKIQFFQRFNKLPFGPQAIEFFDSMKLNTQ